MGNIENWVSERHGGVLHRGPKLYRPTAGARFQGPVSADVGLLSFLLLSSIAVVQMGSYDHFYVQHQVSPVCDQETVIWPRMAARHWESKLGMDLRQQRLAKAPNSIVAS